MEDQLTRTAYLDSSFWEAFSLSSALSSRGGLVPFCSTALFVELGPLCPFVVSGVELHGGNGVSVAVGRLSLRRVVVQRDENVSPSVIIVVSRKPAHSCLNFGHAWQCRHNGEPPVHAASSLLFNVLVHKSHVNVRHSCLL